jgi:glycosyltransferase involved in cell wall biosynthesis
LKILLVIDHFGSGGAQRQMVELACGLKRRGHAVEMFTYFPRRDFFRAQLDRQQITVHEFDKGAGFSLQVVRRIATLVNSGAMDIVVSYLSSPNIYAELARLIAPRAKLVVSERTNHLDDKSWIVATFRRALHAIADQVVANSESQSEWLRHKWWLRGKVTCIYNGLALETFSTGYVVPAERIPLRLIAVGRVGPEKNPLNLIRALEALRRQGQLVELTWVGGRDGSSAGIAYCRQVDELLQSLPETAKHWHWLGEVSDIPRLLCEHHALVHPSLYEGLPNVVCEALAAGMPVLASRVCDHPLLVADGERGFLFDPLDPSDISGAILRLQRLSNEGWNFLSRDARRYAEQNLGADRMVGAYESLFSRLRTGIEPVT